MIVLKLDVRSYIHLKTIALQQCILVVLRVERRSCWQLRSCQKHSLHTCRLRVSCYIHVELYFIREYHFGTLPVQHRVDEVGLCRAHRSGTRDSLS